MIPGGQRQRINEAAALAHKRAVDAARKARAVNQRKVAEHKQHAATLAAIARVAGAR